MIIGGHALASAYLGHAQQLNVICKDSSGLGHHGTYNLGDLIFKEPGCLLEANTAVTFGSDGMVDMGDVADFSFASNIFTIEFWYHTSDISSSNEGVLGKADNPYEYAVYRAGSTLNFKAWTSAGVVVYSTSATIPDTNCHYYVWAADGTNARLYIDAVLQTTVAKSGSSMSNTLAPFRLGQVILP